MAEPRGGPRAQRQAVIRDELIASAEECFLERGFQGSSVAWLASKAGYSTGAIYSGFGDKAGLFLAVLERRAQRQIEMWRAAASSPNAERELSKLLKRQLADDAQLRWTSAYFEFYAFAVREPAVLSAFKELFRRGGKELASALEPLSGRSSIPPGDFVPLVRAASNGLGLVALLDDTTDVSSLMATLLGALHGSPDSSE